MNSAVIMQIIKASRLAAGVPLIAACALFLFEPQHGYAQADAARSNVPEPNWIWAPIKRSPNRAAGICYFRKPFVIRNAKGGQIDIACDDQFVLYVNGIKVASGSGWKQTKRYKIGPYLQRGRNVVAIEAIKSEPGPAGLLATITLFGPDNEQFHMATNPTWKTSLEKKPSWQQAEYIETGWLASHVVATTSDNHHWNQELVRHSADDPVGKEKPSRFKVTREFRVEWVVRPEDSGSLIALSFDEFGNIIASQEGGPLLLIRDADNDGIPERVTTYCEDVKNCQGILAMNGKVLVTADGPDGSGLYELADTDRDGVIDEIAILIPFQGKMQEHGPHGLRLGPDGMIYLIAGNLARLDAEIHDNSPYRHFYEGDLVQPRHEDPRGHAHGVKAPGATVYRIDPNGNRVERFAAGLRNPYDIAFNASGDLFTWDADMEWDESTPWYRPTRINHVVSGGEYGWRSGWAKWPAYYLDSLPGIGETGNGSPTGMVVYDHYMFPSRYHDALFVGDWAQGQILAITLTRQGASYTTETSVFLDGNPLNVTDLEVGPDGLLYFCTGGRGTEGGIYRVKWTGRVPPEVKDRGDGLDLALRQPQMQTAWARQRVALIKRDMGDRWDELIMEMVRDSSVPVARRTRALDLMQLYGPQPSTRLLIQLSNDRERLIRAKAAFLLGIHSNSQAVERLAEMVDDPNMVVQRTACEALVRSGTEKMPVHNLVELLGHDDRHLSFAAAKALQTIPIEDWKSSVTRSEDQRTFLVGCAAILGTNPDQEVCFEILRKLQILMKDFVADREFIDLLRVVQLALHQGEIDAEEVPELTRQVSKEFPSGNALINRELVRILAYL
ncbi:MAG: HEAT repeat domain-containing protein, partial [Planctomycetales bacterium]